MKKPGFKNCRFKILLSDPEGIWNTIWFADATTLEEAKEKTDKEHRERLALQMDPRECHLTIIDRVPDKAVYCTCGFHNQDEEPSNEQPHID